MRTMILLLMLFQKPVGPEVNPNDPDDPGMRLTYEGTVKSGSGNITIKFSPRFGREPGCSFKGSTIPGERPVVTQDSATLRIKAGGTVAYKCEGVRE